MILGNKLNIHLAYVTTNQKSETNIRKCETPRDKLNQKHAQDLNEKFKMVTRDAKKNLNK